MDIFIYIYIKIFKYLVYTQHWLTVKIEPIYQKKLELEGEIIKLIHGSIKRIDFDLKGEALETSSIEHVKLNVLTLNLIE